MGELLTELQQRFSAGDTPNYIGIAGLGEPMLNAEIAVLIKEIKQRTAIPVAVLTNSALLWQHEVCDVLMPADLVLPSLDRYCGRIADARERSALKTSTAGCGRQGVHPFAKQKNSLHDQCVFKSLARIRGIIPRLLIVVGAVQRTPAIGGPRARGCSQRSLFI